MKNHSGDLCLLKSAIYLNTKAWLDDYNRQLNRVLSQSHNSITHRPVIILRRKLLI